MCSRGNGKRVNSCPNTTKIDEEELVQALEEYFTEMLKSKKRIIHHVVKEFTKVYKVKEENKDYEKELDLELNKLKKRREKYMDMYADDLITRSELNEKIVDTKRR